MIKTLIAIVTYRKLDVGIQNIHCSEYPSWYLVRPGSIFTPCACVRVCTPPSAHAVFKFANITAVAVWLVNEA